MVYELCRCMNGRFNMETPGAGRISTPRRSIAAKYYWLGLIPPNLERWKASRGFERNAKRVVESGDRVALFPGVFTSVNLATYSHSHSDRFADPSECHKTESQYVTRHVNHDGAIRFTLHITVLAGEQNRVFR